MTAEQQIPSSWVIVGAGFYPWLVAFFLQKKLINPIKRAGLEAPRLSVVEEQPKQLRPLLSTTSSLRHFNKSVGLSEADFIRACQACFNLGTLIQRNTQPSEDGLAASAANKKMQSTPAFFFAEGPYGLTINGVRFHHLLAQYLAQGKHAALDAFSISAQLAMQNRFTPPSPKPDSLFAAVDYGYRFPANKYRDYLVNLLDSEITVLRAQVKGVKLESTGHAITALQLEDGGEVQGDFFIDVSENRLLKASLSGPIKSPPPSYSGSYPGSYPGSVFQPTAMTRGPLKPYQQITLSAGELFFETRGVNQSYALQLSEPPAADTMFCDPAPWEGNCVALGPAMSARAPIVIDEIHSLLNALFELANFWPRQHAADANNMSRTWFNRNLAAEMAQIHDIDSLFLQRCFGHVGASLSLGAEEKVAMFCETGVLPAREHHTLAEDQWIALLQALGVPLSFENILATQLKPSDVLAQLDQLQQTIKQAASAAPLHEEFLRSHALLKV